VPKAESQKLMAYGLGLKAFGAWLSADRLMKIPYLSLMFRSLTILLLMAIVLTLGCKNDRTETENNTSHSATAINFSELIFESEGSAKTDKIFTTGELVTLRIKGIQDMEQKVQGFSRLLVMSQLGDTLVEMIDPVQMDKMNFLEWHFMITPAFAPNQSYLVIADFHDELSGKNLHAEVPVQVLPAPELALKFSNPEDFISTFFIRCNGVLLRDTETLKTGDELMIFAVVNPNKISKEIPLKVSVKGASGVVMENNNAISPDPSSGAIGFSLQIEPQWREFLPIITTVSIGDAVIELPVQQ
jgi:hypothetical protein